jgi:hypothetical protein
LVTRPGSAFVLILILASFAFKFSITYLMENDAMLLMSFTFQCLWGVGSGTATGLSWGGLLYVIYKLRENLTRHFLSLDSEFTVNNEILS